MVGSGHVRMVEISANTDIAYRQGKSFGSGHTFPADFEPDSY